MKRLFEQDQPIVDRRYLIGSLCITLMTFGHKHGMSKSIREIYTKISQRNRIRRIEIPAPRGKI